MSETGCPRCSRRVPTGKWDGTGGFDRLCGRCKVQITAEQPGFRERLEGDMRRAMEVAEIKEVKP